MDVEGANVNEQAAKPRLPFTPAGLHLTTLDRETPNSTPGLRCVVEAHNSSAQSLVRTKYRSSEQVHRRLGALLLCRNFSFSRKPRVVEIVWASTQHKDPHTLTLHPNAPAPNPERPNLAAAWESCAMPQPWLQQTSILRRLGLQEAKPVQMLPTSSPYRTADCHRRHR